MNRDLLDFMAPPMAAMPQGLSVVPGANVAGKPEPTVERAKGGRVQKEYDVIEEETSRRIVVTTAREIWALDELIRAAGAGCTPIDNPAPRWSAYIYKLKRNHGLTIETINEPHGGQFKGTHGRYVLRSVVKALAAKEGAAT